MKYGPATLSSFLSGLVKKNADALDTFWRIVQLRRSMNLARLGFDPTEA
jgi:hypothetical protein